MDSVSTGTDAQPPRSRKAIARSRVGLMPIQNAACSDIATLCWIEAHPGLAGYVQAVGAVAAILISVYASRSSIKREQAADAAAEQRQIAADKAQQKREQEADAAANRRIRDAKIEAHNSIIQRITSLGILAADECQSIVDRRRATLADATGKIHGGAFQSDRVDELKDVLVLAKRETGDISLLEAISDLQDAIRYEKFEALGGKDYIAASETKLSAIFRTLESIEKLRL